MLVDELTAVAANMKIEYDGYQTGSICIKALPSCTSLGKFLHLVGRDPAPWFSERHRLTGQQHH
jgi:hypothetical protein